MSDETPQVPGQVEKPKTQLDFAFEGINNALYYADFQEFLGISRLEVNNYLHVARDEVLAVDVNTINDEEALRQFIAGGNKLKEVIQKLNPFS